MGHSKALRQELAMIKRILDDLEKGDTGWSPWCVDMILEGQTIAQARLRIFGPAVASKQRKGKK